MRLQVEIKDTLYDQLKLVAGTRGINLSALVREALEDAIDPDKAMAARLWKENDERLDDGLIPDPPRFKRDQAIVPVTLTEVSLVPDTKGNRDAGTIAIGHELPRSPIPDGVVLGKDFSPAPKPVRKSRGK